MPKVKRFNLTLTERTAENIAVGLALNPHIANPTDLLRNALETYVNMSADERKVAQARREYQKAQVTK